MIALLSDIHANLAALEAVLADADAQGADSVLCLGDVVGYHAQPAECIALLRERKAIHILGNHDAYLIEGTDCPRSRRVSEIITFQRSLLSETDINWLRESSIKYIKGSDLYVHGGPTNPTDQYLYVISSSIFPEGVQRLFSGHTHVQMLVRFGELWYCNPGSVGQPRDGDPRAAYALVTQDRIELRRVKYDIDRTVTSMRTAGFESFYFENLYLGAQIGGRIDRVKVISGEASNGTR
jgi:putative phosphoesterase